MGHNSEISARTDWRADTSSASALVEARRKSGSGELKLARERTLSPEGRKILENREIEVPGIYNDAGGTKGFGTYGIGHKIHETGTKTSAPSFLYAAANADQSLSNKVLRKGVIASADKSRSIKLKWLDRSCYLQLSDEDKSKMRSAGLERAREFVAAWKKIELNKITNKQKEEIAKMAEKMVSDEEKLLSSTPADQFSTDLKKTYEPAVKRFFHGQVLSQGEYDTLVGLAYNSQAAAKMVGKNWSAANSFDLEKRRRSQYVMVSELKQKFSTSKGKKLNELVHRREKDAEDLTRRLDEETRALENLDQMINSVKIHGSIA